MLVLNSSLLLTCWPEMRYSDWVEDDPTIKAKSQQLQSTVLWKHKQMLYTINPKTLRSCVLLISTVGFGIPWLLLIRANLLLWKAPAGSQVSESADVLG